MRDPSAADPRRQFQDLEATLLRCPRCGDAVPVRKRLLLVLPEGDKFEYVCTRCSSTCGTKIERPPPASLRI
jgi:DNA-directed RNA polymerase subunit RPC12/RpoP